MRIVVQKYKWPRTLGGGRNDFGQAESKNLLAGGDILAGL